MKRVLFLLVFLLGVLSLRAQDRIVRTNDQSIEVRVLEITPDEVRYKRFSNPDGPTYILPVKDIRYIIYQNGEREEFSDLGSAAEESTPVEAEATRPAAEPTPEPVVSTPEPLYPRTYAVGDYYDQDGVRGVVCHLEEGGRHGLILSLEEETLHWSLFEKGEYRLVGALSKSDGAENMEAVAAYIATNEEVEWSDFPAFAWCRALGEGWYLPAIDEWLNIAFNFNGGSRSVYNRAPRNRFNSSLKEHGGKRLDRLNYYFSSTEEDEAKALAGHMAIEPPYVEPLKKSGIRFLIRAVHKF